MEDIVATQAERIRVLEAALDKAITVIQRTTELFHPKYLLETDRLIKDIRAVQHARSGV